MLTLSACKLRKWYMKHFFFPKERKKSNEQKGAKNMRLESKWRKKPFLWSCQLHRCIQCPAGQLPHYSQQPEIRKRNEENVSTTCAQWGQLLHSPNNYSKFNILMLLLYITTNKGATALQKFSHASQEITDYIPLIRATDTVTIFFPQSFLPSLKWVLNQWSWFLINHFLKLGPHFYSFGVYKMVPLFSFGKCVRVALQCTRISKGQGRVGYFVQHPPAICREAVKTIFHFHAWSKTERASSFVHYMQLCTI